MAQVTGFVCDICKTYTEDKSTWLRLNTNATTPGERGSGWDICSNRCLIKLGRDRAQADGPPKSVRTRRSYEPEFRREVGEHALNTSPREAAEKYDVDIKNVYRWAEEVAS